MISEETMRSVKDIAEAVCLLSNFYKEKGIKDRATSAYITGGAYTGDSQTRRSPHPCRKIYR